MIEIKVLESKEHPRGLVEGPFATFPCDCDTETLIVHITSGDTLGDDLAECPSCKHTIRLGDLYGHLKMPGLEKS